MLDRLVVVQLVEAVHGQLDLQRRGLRVARSGSSSHACESRRWASSWRPCQCSTAAHRAVSSTAARGVVRGQQSTASSSVERQRSSSPSERRAEASATLRSTWRAESAAGSSRSAASYQRRRRRGCARGGGIAGRQQQLDRGLVSRGGRLLDVMSALAGRRAAGRERLRRAPVRREPPSPASGLVHRLAHERVAEHEAGAAPGWAARDPARAGRPARSGPSSSDSFAAAAARSGSNGSPATAAPFSIAR